MTNPPRLTPQQIDEIESVLAASDSDIQDFEMLDGFIAALVTGPELLMPSQYLPELLGDPHRPHPALANLEAANQFLQSLMNHWNTQVSTFMAGQPWFPLVNEEERTAEGWAQGFQLGASLQRGWEPLAGKHADLLGSILWLAYDGNPEKPGKPPSEAERKVMYLAIAEGLPLLYADTRPGAAKSVRKKRSPRARPKRPPKKTK